MIVRVFRARVRSGQTADFEATVREHSLARIRESEGIVSWWAGRPLGETGEFVVVTVWRDLESLRGFAGPDWQREAVLPADVLPMLDETLLHHYELFDSSPA